MLLDRQTSSPPKNWCAKEKNEIEQSHKEMKKSWVTLLSKFLNFCASGPQFIGGKTPISYSLNLHLFLYKKRVNTDYRIVVVTYRYGFVTPATGRFGQARNRTGAAAHTMMQ